MDRSLVEQEREIKEAIRRARHTLDKSSTIRRETFKRLINLIHSPHASLKILAAGNIRYFFIDFPDLEETAINAVYDLCEDQSPQVRIEGYSAITQISTVSPKWIKRNADVLLQLLQSDEPDEVVIVKKALCEHLDMDPKVTLGVLCDQITPPSATVDEEEQTIRDRLRALVIAFLTGEAKRAIVERHAVPGSGAEEILTRGLLEAIPRLPSSDVEIIIKDLLLSLPAYKQNSQAGTALLRVLLNRTTANLRNDLRAAKDVSLNTALPYLTLSKLLVLQHPVASPSELLRFYVMSLAGKMTLQKLAPESQLTTICELIEILAACESDSSSQSSQDLALLRKQIVDACPYLLETLEKVGLSNPRAANACTALLRCCKRRKEEQAWSVAPNLVSILHRLQSRPETGRLRTLQDLIRSLLPSQANTTPNLPQTQSKTPTPQPQSQKRSFDSGAAHPSLPPRPSSSTGSSTLPAQRRLVHISRPRPEANDIVMAELSPETNNAKLGQTDADSRPIKRRKEDELSIVGAASGRPSLLSRLASSTPSSPSATTSSNGTTRPVNHAFRTTVPLASSDHRPTIAPASPAAVGFSIKGAARMENKTNLSFSAQVRPPEGPPTLLDRLERNSSNRQVVGGGDGRGGIGRRRGQS